MPAFSLTKKISRPCLERLLGSPTSLSPGLGLGLGGGARPSGEPLPTLAHASGRGCVNVRLGPHDPSQGRWDRCATPVLRAPLSWHVLCSRPPVSSALGEESTMAADAPIGIHISRALKTGSRLAARRYPPPPVRQDGEGSAAIQSSDTVFGVARAARTGRPDPVFRAGDDSFPAGDRPRPMWAAPRHREDVPAIGRIDLPPAPAIRIRLAPAGAGGGRRRGPPRGDRPWRSARAFVRRRSAMRGIAL